VGRQSEMGLLRSALAEAVTGSGRCFEQSGPAPYWPWVQVLRAYARDGAAAQRYAEIPLEAAVIAELVPEVRDKLPNLNMPSPLDDLEQGRLRLFDAITTLFKCASQRQPLVLVLDNLHWADQSSLLLLEFMAEELAEAHLLVLGTYRDTEFARGHPLRQTLGELVKLPHFRRLSLAGLTEADVAQFITLVCGVSSPRALVRELHSRTAGNPLFITEVVRLLQQQGVLSREGMTAQLHRDLGLPAGVREAIRSRLDRLSQDCHRVLTFAAIVGRQFGLAELERLVDTLSSGQVLDALEEALAAGIVEEVPGMFGAYQFTHVLIQETLASALSSTRRARSLVAEGLALARELGMAPVTARLVSLQEKIQAQAVTPAYPMDLTEREVAVLRCLAAGKSNKAIAAELFISPHTVNYHLKNIFFKTGAANRAEAAAFAVRHRLV
jgi:predicted ATPase